MGTIDRICQEEADIHAAVALLKALELADGELSVRDVNFAIGQVLDWMYDMGQEFGGNADEGSLLFGQVCREAGIDPDGSQS